MTSARSLMLAFLAAAFIATPAHAQFPFGQRNQQPAPPSNMQGDPGELSIRIERLENQLRQLTGIIEQLQHQNQQLQQQLRSVQGENPPPQQRPLTQQQQRPQYVPPAAQQNVPLGPQQQAVVPPLPPVQNQQQQYPQQNPKGRGDAFDPDANPNAPGTPRNLGAIRQQQNTGPMDLNPNAAQNPSQNLPPPDQNPPGPQQQAVLPPSNSAKDAYDLAYGYILRRDYALAEQSFRAFIGQYPQDRNIPQASYWLGESLYYQRKHNDAAEIFLDIYNKYPNSQRAPDSLLRLGQSLAALGKKDAACASLGAVLSKYPKASPTVKKNAEDEQKRLSC